MNIQSIKIKQDKLVQNVLLKHQVKFLMLKLLNGYNIGQMLQ